MIDIIHDAFICRWVCQPDHLTDDFRMIFPPDYIKADARLLVKSLESCSTLTSIFTMTSDIRALINIISAQVDTIEAKYAKAGESCPSLDQPEPTFGALDHDPEMDRAKDIATAAAAQLLASLRSPLDTVYEMACGTLQTAALGFVEEVNIANILAEAGPQVRATSICHYGIGPKDGFAHMGCRVFTSTRYPKRAA